MVSYGMRRWWAVGALALSLLAVGVDGTVLNLALPTLATTLHASTVELQWFVDAYSLTFAAALLPAGLLGDRFGRKRLLLLALVLFGVASVACAYTSSAQMLIMARIVLALGGAFLLPLSLAVLPVMFSVQERPRALTALLFTTVLAFPIGPIVGGWLLTNMWWGSVFLINVPIVGLALVAVFFLLPESRSAEQRGLDLVGVLTSSAGLLLTTYAVIEAGEKGWGDIGTLTMLLLGLAIIALFVFWEQLLTRRGGQPLVELALFRIASFSWGTILATLGSFTMFGVLFTVPQYFTAVMGTDAMGAGFRLLPLVGGLLVGGGMGDQLGRKIGLKVTVAAGFALMAVGLLLGTTTSVASDDGFTATWVTLVGVGMGFALPTSMDAALGTLSAERSGVGSALIQAIRQVGATFGVALLGAILNSTYREQLHVTGLPAAAADAVRSSATAGVMLAKQSGATSLLNDVRAAFVAGMDSLLLVCGGIGVVGLLLALIFLPKYEGKVDEQDTEAVESAHEIIIGS